MDANQEKAKQKMVNVSPYEKDKVAFHKIHQNVNGLPFSKEGLQFDLALKIHTDAFSFAKNYLEWNIPELNVMMKDTMKLIFHNVKTSQTTSSQIFKKL